MSMGRNGVHRIFFGKAMFIDILSGILRITHITWDTHVTGRVTSLIQLSEKVVKKKSQNVYCVIQPSKG